MSSEQDWREVARGIPVWEGCAAFRRNGEAWTRVRVELIDTVPTRVAVLVYGDDYEVRPADVFPDLSDPDTRAAYDRRLALALGAPVEAVAEGVHFGFDSVREEWRVSAGWDPEAWSWTWATDLPLVKSGNDLVARALARPADKRVRQ